MAKPEADEADRLLGETLDRIERRLERVEALPAKGPPPGQGWLSIKQAAHVTGLPQSHVRRAIRAGRPGASNVGTEAHPIWRILRGDLSAVDRREPGSEPA